MKVDTLEIRKIDTLAGLLALEKEWKKLEAIETFVELGSSFEIARLAWEVSERNPDPIFGLRPKLIILTAYDGSELVAIAPLVKVIRQRQLGPMTFNVSCVQFVSQLPERFFRLTADIVTRTPSAALTNVFLNWLYMHEKFDVLHLAHIREGAVSFPLSAPNLFVTDFDSVVAVGQFADFETYRKETYSRRFKNNLRTGINRAKKAKLNLTISIEQLNPDNMKEISSVGQLKSIASAFAAYGGESFIAEACRRLPSEVVMARVDGRAVGYRIYLTFNSSKHMVDTAFDRTYVPFEIGSRMSESAIEDSFKRKLLFHSEGLWASWHMYKFASQCPKLYKYVLPGNTFRGKAGAWAVALRQRAIEIERDRKKSKQSSAENEEN